MSTTPWRVLPLLTLFLLVGVLATSLYVSAQGTRASGKEVGCSWIADRVDSICGLDDPRLLSRPARIDYSRVMERTPEMKKMRDEHIDPASSVGIQLTTLAADRVRAASEKARVQGGFCSVWKRISHKDGRDVPDITAQVIALL